MICFNKGLKRKINMAVFKSPNPGLTEPLGQTPLHFNRETGSRIISETVNSNYCEQQCKLLLE